MYILIHKSHIFKQFSIYSVTYTYKLQDVSKTIIVSNRLPVKISRGDSRLEFSPSEGGLATGLGSIYKEQGNIWIGWPGMVVEEDIKGFVSEKLKELNLVPVFLTEEDITGYYEGFSNEVLWPVFHYISTYARFDLDKWESYKNVNQKFAQIISQYIEPGDTVWVHDYQLLLLPNIIREQFPEVSIAFFQHIPFPSQELFRMIPWRKELLSGILGADLVGFHTYDDVRHFISAATQLLDLHIDGSIIRMDERAIAVEPFPMGIDSRKFSELSESNNVKEIENRIKSSYKNQRILLSIDRLDYSKGIIQRLEAYHQFLEDNSEYHEKVVLFMIVVPSRDNVLEYQRLKDEVDRLVGNINSQHGKYDWTPVAYFYNSFPIEYLSALYNIADVCLVTSMRDGMNLVCKEYIASRNDNTGVLILSEMAGASKELNDALIINPNNLHEVKDALVEALNMPEEEMRDRMSTMRELIFKYNIDHWVKIYMARLSELIEIKTSMKTRLVKEQLRNEIAQLYNQASKRLILLDYDGTLVGFKKQIDLASPDRDLLELLDKFITDKKNTTTIISGRKHQTLEKWFGNRALFLVAEHGAWTKDINTAWKKKQGLSDSWKEEVHQLMDDFCDRTPGSFIEEKSYSLVWHYRKVQKGLGPLRANNLMDNLRYIIPSYGLQLLNGDKVVEVKQSEVNKGKAALQLLEKEKFDFILAIGDDYTDEDTFKVLPDSAITIKVGNHLSSARFSIKNQLEVRAFLKSLVTSS